MKTLYFDCRSGISGDMVLEALIALQEKPDEARTAIAAIRKEIEVAALILRHQPHHHGHDHSHENHDHTHPHTHDHAHTAQDSTHFHRSYHDVKHIIADACADPAVQEIARSIYAVIAAAESSVHESSLEELHFHEVGRNQAIGNILGAAWCVNNLQADSILCSEIYDGHGTVQCAHGVIPVPVPAVMAMRKNCSLSFREADVEGEMVTPSGLSILIGIGAQTGAPSGRLLKAVTANGTRAFSGHEGLTVSIYESHENAI